MAYYHDHAHNQQPRIPDGGDLPAVIIGRECIPGQCSYYKNSLAYSPEKMRGKPRAAFSERSSDYPSMTNYSGRQLQLKTSTNSRNRVIKMLYSCFCNMNDDDNDSEVYQPNDHAVDKRSWEQYAETQFWGRHEDIRRQVENKCEGSIYSIPVSKHTERSERTDDFGYGWR